MTSYAGTYTCQETLTSPFGTIQVSAIRSENVSIESKPCRVTFSVANQDRTIVLEASRVAIPDTMSLKH